MLRIISSQQGVWVSFWTPKPLKSTPQDTQRFLCGIFKNVNLKHIIEFFHLHIIPMTLYKDIMPYFDKFIHVYGWNMSILWSPSKFWTPQNFAIANFRHPVSKSWLRPCFLFYSMSDIWPITAIGSVSLANSLARLTDRNKWIYTSLGTSETPSISA